ncbi:thermonuclease family protein [Peptostreptococcus sp. D1]|uniref:thermonuclease family protein n=1 Tax=Peptostreptococcus sp. D1 TaxID=72304 RepID=UPI0008E0A3D8|nr:thermonuclease family protein [Peptostreptococcus sp. D1]SFE84840.1 micrococcal nuclease [Peptostreptococcus sp. D1]
MFVFLSFVFFISFISLIVFGILTIKNRKNNKKKKYVKNCKILIGIIIASFIGCGFFAPDDATKNASNPVEVNSKKEASQKVDKVKSEPKKTEQKPQKVKAKPVVSNHFDEAKVVRVIDGDTIHISINGQTHKLRLIGVDTPETVHPNKPVEFYGKEASDFTKNSLADKTIYLQKDVSETDKYGRLLRYVWLERPSSDDPIEDEVVTKMYNAILVKNGYAHAYTYQPDSKYSTIFARLQHTARENNIGLWSNAQIEEQPKSPDNNTTNYNADTTENGKIKGNRKSMKYHVPGGMSYNKISEDNVVYFDTEQEAIDAGYIRAKR